MFTFVIMLPDLHSKRNKLPSTQILIVIYVFNYAAGFDLKEPSSGQ